MHNNTDEAVASPSLFLVLYYKIYDPAYFFQFESASHFQRPLKFRGLVNEHERVHPHFEPVQAAA